MLKSILSGQYVVISAEKSYYTNSDNDARTLALERMLRRRGFDPLFVVGCYEGRMERSFLVPGMSEEMALQLAETFDQDSILTGDGLR
ncbi:DUF3293 domain-containing protein, partial [Nitrolancea hollandica]|uniref:DUF3293 domain-containing protein n=1 Tax=Nitrolancea hollandica TaxID=1206749 RepID=UPI0005902E09